MGDAVSGAPRRAAVLGHPVAHSLSPVLHRAAYHALGLRGWDYGRHDVTEEQLAPFVASLPPEWAGLSLTMPLKQVALGVVDVVEPLARTLGTANTIVFSPGGLSVAANTDVHGIVAALREAEPVHAPATLRRGVIVGAGATAASTLAAFAELGLTAPVVLVRSVGRAGVVMRAAASCGVDPTYVRLGTAKAREVLLDAEVVVSTIPGEGSDGLAEMIEGARLAPQQVLLDVVYEGWPTRLPTAWRAAGGSVSPGYLMLLHQAREQVRLMTGAVPALEPMRVALLAAVGA